MASCKTVQQRAKVHQLNIQLCVKSYQLILLISKKITILQTVQ